MQSVTPKTHLEHKYSKNTGGLPHWHQEVKMRDVMSDVKDCTCLHILRWQCVVYWQGSSKNRLHRACSFSSTVVDHWWLSESANRGWLIGIPAVQSLIYIYILKNTIDPYKDQPTLPNQDKLPSTIPYNHQSPHHQDTPSSETEYSRM